jgi:DNA-binding transcriptional MerR regulator
MPISVSEIAERTGHGASKASNRSFIERLHYWTRERLLLPTGKRYPGSGKRRLYPVSALQEALLLNVMLEAGVSVEDQRTAMKVLREQPQRTPGHWPEPFLVIETHQGKSKLYFTGGYTADPRIERAVVISLAETFSILQDQTGGANG